MSIQITAESDNTLRRIYGIDQNGIYWMTDELYGNLGSNSKNLSVDLVFVQISTGKEYSMRDVSDARIPLDDITARRSTAFESFLVDMFMLEGLRMFPEAIDNPDIMKIYGFDVKDLEALDKIDRYLSHLGIDEDYPLKRDRYNMVQTIKMGYTTLSERITNGNIYS